VEVQGLFLGSNNKEFSAASSGNLLLARPVRDASQGWREIGLVQVLPPNYTGVELVTLTSSFWGPAVHARSCLRYDPGFHLDGTFGYRTLGLNENLTISDAAVSRGAPAAGMPMSRVVGDRFAARNQFHGPRVGFETGWVGENFTLDLRGSLAMGG